MMETDSSIDISRLLRDEDEENISDDEEFTAPIVLNLIENAWLNEKLSAEILPHKSIYVDAMYQQILTMEDNISKLPSDDIRIDIYQLELDRIRYIITSYLRIRLEKIERFTKQILQQEAQRSVDDQYLSFHELQYAKSFQELNEKHLNLVLKKMPANVASLSHSQTLIRPNLEHFVFIRSRVSQDGLFIPDIAGNEEREVKLTENSQFILPYNSVSELVKNNSVQLI
ncbi:DNA replication complex GINS protein SLD5 [Bemisia tabaci]|nr:PREDICTED: DNA replication complex GINS protein SLD5 [Bemisia tabaci]